MKREDAIRLMHQYANPVLECVINKRTMPFVGKISTNQIGHEEEALCRTVYSLSPYLSKNESNKGLYKLVLDALEVTFESRPGIVRQDIIETGYLVQAFFRCPRMFTGLSNKSQDNIIDQIRRLRTIRPLNNNWLLMAALPEAWLLHKKIDRPDLMRIDYAVRQFMQWYAGDGIYNDGPELRFDYYNSLVIHPALNDIFSMVYGEDPVWDEMSQVHKKRNERYLQILDSQLPSDGKFAVIGRSACYRQGAFHALFQAALDGNLSYAGSVNRRITKSIQTMSLFRPDGFLKMGFNSEKESLDMAEPYISTGSLYAFGFVFLPLGLTEDSQYWSAEDIPSTQESVWNGDRSFPFHSLGNPGPL